MGFSDNGARDGFLAHWMADLRNPATDGHMVYWEVWARCACGVHILRKHRSVGPQQRQPVVQCPGGFGRDFECTELRVKECAMECRACGGPHPGCTCPRARNKQAPPHLEPYMSDRANHSPADWDPAPTWLLHLFHLGPWVFHGLGWRILRLPAVQMM